MSLPVSNDAISYYFKDTSHTDCFANTVQGFIDTLAVGCDLKEKLKTRHKLTQTELNGAEKQLKLISMIFGDHRFYDKRLPDGSELEGIPRNVAIYTYMKTIYDYILKIDKLSNSIWSSDREIEQQFKDLFAHYPLFYVSSLLYELLINNEISEEQAVDLLYRDMVEVLQGDHKRKKRGAWVSGYPVHSIPFVYEKIETSEDEEPKLKLSFFNLGNQTSSLQIGYFKDKVFNETRVGNLVTKQGEVVCTKSWLEEHLLKFCRRLHKVLTGGDGDSFMRFINSYLPKKAKRAVYLCHTKKSSYRRNPLRDVICQPLQVIGDCSCRGQWAMLRSAAHYEGIHDEEMRHFKLFLRKRQIDVLNKKFAEINKEVLNFNQKEGKVKTAEQIYLDCFSAFVRLSSKRILRQQELEACLPEDKRWQARCCRICIPNSSKSGEKELMTTLCLKDLFQGRTKVIIGLYEASLSSFFIQKDDAAIYYGLSCPQKNKPAYGDYFTLTREKSAIYVSTNLTVPITVYNRDGKSRSLSKDDMIVIDKRVQKIAYGKEGSSFLYFIESIRYREYFETASLFNQHLSLASRDSFSVLKRCQQGKIVSITRSESHSTQYRLHWLAPNHDKTTAYLANLNSRADEVSIWRQDRDLSERPFSLPCNENLIQNIEQRLLEMPIERAFRRALQRGLKEYKTDYLFKQEVKTPIRQKTLHVALLLKRFYYKLTSRIEKNKRHEYYFSITGDTISVWKDAVQEPADLQLSVAIKDELFVFTDSAGCQFAYEKHLLVVSLAMLFYKKISLQG